jgi:hypothetical protein
MLATLSASFWVLILALVALICFLVAMGAFKPDEAVGVSVAAVALAVLWVAHAWWLSRHGDGRDLDSLRARERRGF